MIEGKCEITFKDQMNWYVSDWRNFRFIAVFSFVLGLATGSSQFDKGMVPAILYFLLPFIAILLGAILISAVWFYWHFKKMPDDQKSIQWDIDHAALKISDAAGNMISSPWQEYGSIKTTKRGWLLVRNNGCSSQWIARRAFNSKMGAKFETLAAEKLG